jgi:hypothetical protein
VIPSTRRALTTRGLSGVHRPTYSGSTAGLRSSEGAVETCNALLIEGHNLLYISNRATESEDATRRWLVTNHFFGGHIPRVHEDQYVTLVVTMGDKRPFIKDCQYLIDDRLKTCVDFVHDPYWQVEHGFRGEEGSLERKAPTWAGLNEYLVTKDVLSQEAFIPLGLARV